MKILKQQNLGVAIGSGGVYSAAGLGVIQKLEEKGLKIPFVGGASAGAIIAALYYLEGDGKKTQTKLLKKLPHLAKLKLYPWKKPIPGKKVRELISGLLDERDWQDGKIQAVCFGAAYVKTKEPVILTKKSGLSLTDSVLASVSLKMIEPIVKLNGKLIAHGGELDYIKGMRELGADFVIEVSPNLDSGISGKTAKIGNIVSSLIILRGDYWKIKRVRDRKKEKADREIHPNISVRPLIQPLDFSKRNTEYMIKQGRKLTDTSISKQRKVEK